MASPLARFADVARPLGLARALTVAPAWLLRTEYLVLVGDLARPLPAIPPEPPLHWTVATEGEIDLVRAVSPALPEYEIRRRWREGQRCVVSWYASAPASWLWETESPMVLPYLGLTLWPRAGDTLNVDVFTAVPFRGRGIDRASSIASLHRAWARGATRSLAFVAPWNAPTMRVASTRMGRTVAGSVGYWWVPPRRRCFTRGDVRVEDGARLLVH